MFSTIVRFFKNTFRSHSVEADLDVNQRYCITVKNKEHGVVTQICDLCTYQQVNKLVEEVIKKHEQNGHKCKFDKIRWRLDVTGTSGRFVAQYMIEEV